MKTGKIIILVSALLTVFFAAEVFAASLPMAPDFTLQDMNGKNVSLIFTTTWCPYCKKEVPELKEMYSKYKGKLEILAIDMNESKTKVESYINKYQITYTTLLDTEATVARNYGIRGVPTKVLVGPDGKLFCYPCYDLANQVEELLKKPAAPPKSVEKEIKEKGRATIDVKFKTNKADIVPDYDSELVKFADVLKKYPDLNVTIEGYTDNKGTAKYNKTLSQKRAESVKKYFVDKLGIDASRLKAVGYGPEKPIADNKTEEGRKKNRRVEASVDYRTEKNVK